MFIEYAADNPVTVRSRCSDLPDKLNIGEKSTENEDRCAAGRRELDRLVTRNGCVVVPDKYVSGIDRRVNAMDCER